VGEMSYNFDEQKGREVLKYLSNRSLNLIFMGKKKRVPSTLPTTDRSLIFGLAQFILTVSYSTLLF